MAEQALIRRKCDYCDTVQELPAQQAEIKPDTAASLAGWVTLVRLFLVRGQIHPVQLHACKDSCAMNIISLGQLDLPAEIKHVLEQDKKAQQEYAKKIAAAKQHRFTPSQGSYPNSPPSTECTVEGCGLSEMAHAAGEA